MQRGFFLDISPQADLGQRGWVSKCCIQDSLKYAFQARGKESWPGCQLSTACHLVRSTVLCMRLRDCKHGCVQDIGGNVLFYLSVGKKRRHKDQAKTCKPDHFQSLAQRMLPRCPQASCADPPVLRWSPYPPGGQKYFNINRLSHLASVLFFVCFNVPTTFSRDRRTPIFPKRTWKGEHCREPSGCLTTMTSMQPDRVAGLRPR